MLLAHSDRPMAPCAGHPCVGRKGWDRGIVDDGGQVGYYISEETLLEAAEAAAGSPEFEAAKAAAIDTARAGAARAAWARSPTCGECECAGLRLVRGDEGFVPAEQDASWHLFAWADAWIEGTCTDLGGATH